MKAPNNWSRQIKTARRKWNGLRKQAGSIGKTAMAAAAGAALLMGNLGKSVKDRALDMRDSTFYKKERSGEVIEMRKSTVIALLVALAAVAGVLGALYFYVLRREKELDEYEQLLFSEDFNDDLLDDEEDEEAQPAEA